MKMKLGDKVKINPEVYKTYGSDSILNVSKETVYKVIYISPDLVVIRPTNSAIFSILDGPDGLPYDAVERTIYQSHWVGGVDGTFIIINQNENGALPTPAKIIHKHNCPLCGSKGDDLIFRFYCSNNSCKNWHP